jgi:hypothetical protein
MYDPSAGSRDKGEWNKLLSTTQDFQHSLLRQLAIDPGGSAQEAWAEQGRTAQPLNFQVVVVVKILQRLFYHRTPG